MPYERYIEEHPFVSGYDGKFVRGNNFINNNAAYVPPPAIDFNNREGPFPSNAHSNRYFEVSRYDNREGELLFYQVADPAFIQKYKRQIHAICHGQMTTGFKFVFVGALTEIDIPNFQATAILRVRNKQKMVIRHRVPVTFAEGSQMIIAPCEESETNTEFKQKVEICMGSCDEMWISGTSLDLNIHEPLAMFLCTDNIWAGAELQDKIDSTLAELNAHPQAKRKIKKAKMVPAYEKVHPQNAVDNLNKELEGIKKRASQELLKVTKIYKSPRTGELIFEVAETIAKLNKHKTWLLSEVFRKPCALYYGVLYNQMVAYNPIADAPIALRRNEKGELEGIILSIRSNNTYYPVHVKFRFEFDGYDAHGNQRWLPIDLEMEEEEQAGIIEID